MQKEEMLGIFGKFEGGSTNNFLSLS